MNVKTLHVILIVVTIIDKILLSYVGGLSMAYFNVKTQTLQSASVKEMADSVKMATYVLQIASIRNSLSLQSASNSIIKGHLKNIEEAVSRESKDLLQMSTALATVAKDYETTENKIVGHVKFSSWVGAHNAVSGIARQIFDSVAPPWLPPRTRWGGGATDWIHTVVKPQMPIAVPIIPPPWARPGYVKPILPPGWKPAWPEVSPNTQKIWDWITSPHSKEDSIWGNVYPGQTSIGPIAIAGSAAYDLIGYETKYTPKFGISTNSDGKVDFAGAGVEGSATGYLARGKGSYQIGHEFGDTFVGSKTDATAYVGKVGAKGGLGATLVKDGRIDPQIYGEASVSASAVSGKVSNQLGTDNNNYHTSAEGDLLTAKAEVKGQIGHITTTNEDGTVTDAGWGVSGKAGASAYGASGKVKGGFTICGIKIDLSVKGHAGGAGAEVSGHATTGGVKAGLDLGLGLGAGAEIEIDWSNFKFGW